MQIDGSYYQMVIDNINPYLWLYFKNPNNNHLCINCPSTIQQFHCKEIHGCEKLQNSESITLSNSNKCILTKNNIMLDQSSFDNFQICLSYDISNQQYKQNGVLSLESPNKSNLFNKQYSMEQIDQISTKFNQLRIRKNLHKRIEWILTIKNNKLLKILIQQTNAIILLKISSKNNILNKKNQSQQRNTFTFLVLFHKKFFTNMSMYKIRLYRQDSQNQNCIQWITPLNPKFLENEQNVNQILYNIALLQFWEINSINKIEQYSIQKKTQS